MTPKVVPHKPLKKKKKKKKKILVTFFKMTYTPQTNIPGPITQNLAQKNPKKKKKKKKHYC
jgi:hypothetical protein